MFWFLFFFLSIYDDAGVIPHSKLWILYFLSFKTWTSQPRTNQRHQHPWAAHWTIPGQCRSSWLLDFVIANYCLFDLDSLVLAAQGVTLLLTHPSHICLSHICCFHCPQDGSNTRHCSDLVRVPEFYGDHESQSTTYTTWWCWRQNTCSFFRMQHFLLCADILTGVIFMLLN